MSVESSEVSIRINVTDVNSGAAVGSVTENLNKLGDAGASAGAKAGKGVRDIGGHALSSLDNVRLLRDDFGIHIPRAMEKAIASSKMLSGIIGSIGGLLITFGAIEIGYRIFSAAITGAHTLWKEHLSLTQAAKDYAAEVQKNASDDFTNTRSIETTRARIDEATEAVTRFHAKSLEAAKEFPTDAGFWDRMKYAIPGAGQAFLEYDVQSRAHDLEGQSVDAQRKADELRKKQAPEQAHQAALDQIELQHAADGRLRGEQKITAEKVKQHQIDTENMRFDANREGLYKDYLRDSNLKLATGSKEKQAREKQDADLANIVAPDAGAATYGVKDRIAAAKADAELFNLRREHAHELARMREEALEAGLRGVDLRKAQEAAAIEELKFKDIDSVAARQAVHDKFHAQELKLIQDEQRETEKLGREAGLAGMTGIGRIQAEGANRVADINADPNLDPAQKAERVQYALQETNAQIAAEQRTFAEQVDSIVQQSQGRQIQGFARIQVEAQKATAELQKQFDKAHELMDVSTPAGMAQLNQDRQQLGVGLDAIGAGAGRETNDLARRNEQETEQIETQARVKWFNAEKQKTVAIQSEYDERLRKYKEELQAQEISQGDYDRRAAAAAQEANAELVAASREAREKMAGQFDQLFRGMEHPTKYLEEQGNKALGEMAARLVQRFQKNPADGDQGSGKSGGLLGSLLGGFGGGKAQSTIPNQTAGHDQHGAVEKTFAIAQATIHVGSAMFTGGSTGMLTPGGSGASGGFSGGGSGSSGGGWGSGTYGSGDFVGGYSRGGNTLGFSGGGAGSGSGAGSSPSDAGGSSASSAGGNFTAGSAGQMPAPHDFMGSASHAISQGMGAFKLGADIVSGIAGGGNPGGNSGGGGGADPGGNSGADQTTDPQTPQVSGQFDSSGNFQSGGSGGVGGNIAAGGVGGAVGAAQAGVGLFSQEQGHGGGGMLGGAEKGAQVGMEFFGPIGGAVGAAIGVALAIKGEREQARVYDLKQVQPRLTADQDAYAQGSMSYLEAYSDVQQMIGTSWAATKKIGVEGGAYWNSNIKPELEKTMGKFTAEERAGRSQYTASGQSFATGTPYVPETGDARVHAGERIFSSVDNSAITRAVTQGNSSTMPVQQGMAGDLHVHLNALDSKTGSQFLADHMHDVRDAYNQSFSENSGGGLN